MPRIVILGIAAEAFACLEQLRQSGLSGSCTLISPEEVLPYRQDLLLQYSGQLIQESQIMLCDKDYFTRNQIIFLKNKKCAKLDTRKQNLVTKDNDRVPYDYLVIALGAGCGLPDLPGIAKDGVFSLFSLSQAKQVLQRLAYTDTLAIFGPPNECLRYYQIFSAKSRQIKIVSAPKPAEFVSSEQAEWIEGAVISEIIGDGQELKAFKLDNGKVIAAGLMVYAGESRPAGEFLKDGSINISNGYVLVDEAMKTNFPNILACGQLACAAQEASRVKSFEQVCAEGVRAANSLVASLERGTVSCPTCSSN